MLDRIVEFGAGIIAVLGIGVISILLLKVMVWMIVNFGSGL